MTVVLLVGLCSLGLRVTGGCGELLAVPRDSQTYRLPSLTHGQASWIGGRGWHGEAPAQPQRGATRELGSRNSDKIKAQALPPRGAVSLTPSCPSHGR